MDLAKEELQKALQDEPVYLHARLLLTDIKIRENRMIEAKKEFRRFQRYEQIYYYLKVIQAEPYLVSLVQVNEEYKERLRKHLFP